MVEGDHFHNFLRTAGFYLTVRNSLSVQDEPLLDIWTFCFFGALGTGIFFGPDGNHLGKTENEIFKCMCKDLPHL